jgi:hypothetical protein
VRYFRTKLATRAHLREVAEKNKSFGYTYLMSGFFADFVSYVAIPPGTNTFQSYAKPTTETSWAVMSDVVKYLVASTLVPLSSGERPLRIPGGNYSWASIIDMIEKGQGKKFDEVKWLDITEAQDGEKKAREDGRVDDELNFSLVQILAQGGNIKKPWDHAKFPEITPVPLDVFFGQHFAPKN